MFFDRVEERLAELERLAHDEERQEMRRLAHELRGSAANLGLARLAAICATLEANGADATGEHSPPSVDELLRQVGEASQEALTEWERQRRPL